MRSLVLVLGLVLTAPVVLGCEPRIELELVEISDVEPARIDAGHRLAVHGQRFLMGHPCTVVLRGLWHRPGRGAERGEHTLLGEATSGERAEAVVTADAIRDLGGRATFVGEVEVRFEAASIAGGSVHGVLRDVTLDFVPAAHGALGGELEIIERGLGARFADVEGDPLEATDARVAGVELAEVDVDGPLGRAGLVAGDHLVTRGGLRVLLPTDLTDSELGDAEPRLGVVRGGGEPFEIRLGVEAPPETSVPRTYQLAALIALVGVLGAVATRRRTASAPTARLAGPAHVVLAVLAALGLWRGIALGWLSDASVVVGVVALVVALAAASEKGPSAALRGLVRALALTSTMLSVVAIAGTSELSVLFAPSLEPASWLGLSSPLAPAAILGVVLASSPRSSTPLVSVLDALALGLTAALTTAALYGGVGEAGAGAVSFALRAVVVLAVLAVLRAPLASLEPRFELALGIGAILLAPLATMLVLTAPLDVTTRTIFAETLALGIVAAVVVTGIARARTAPRLADELEL